MGGTKKVFLIASALFLALTGSAIAGGFNIYEAGARATALGGAFTATADDGSAIFYNSAGMAFLTGSGIDANLMPVAPDFQFKGADAIWLDDVSGDTVDQSFPIPGIYLYRQMGEGLTFGIGAYAPFGLGVEWENPETWAGRHLSYDVDLATIYVSPAVAYKFTDKAALSLGLDIAFTTIELNRFSATEFGGYTEPVDVLGFKLDGTSNLNITPQIGMMVNATDRLTFGAMFHFEKKMVFEDEDATLRNIVADTPQTAALRSAVDDMLAGLGGGDQKVNADLYMPHILSLGVAYQFTPALRAEFDAVHFGWSAFEELTLDFDQDALDSTIEEAYEDVWQYRFGVSYAFNDRLTAMTGLVIDESPQPIESMSPMLPDSDRTDYSLGLQYKLNEHFTGTLSYMAVAPEERSNVINGEQQTFDPETNPAGSYTSVANIWGIGLGYRF